MRKQIDAAAMREIASAAADRSRRGSSCRKPRRTGEDLTVTAPFDGTVMTRAAEPGEVVQAGTAIVTLLDLARFICVASSRRADRQSEDRAGGARLSGFDPTKPLDAYVQRIDPQATFTPENTYFRDDRVKQVVGVKLQLEERNRFRQAGHAGGWRDPGAGRHLAARPVQPDDRRPSARADRANRQLRRAGIAIRIRDLLKRYGAVEAVRGSISRSTRAKSSA